MFLQKYVSVILKICNTQFQDLMAMLPLPPQEFAVRYDYVVDGIELVA
jgi:hypothetical protein